ncbi:uncharacterized protein I303_106725 [Kwoniella dejecticola CBS 10117]|uniref:Uncharacterized protein n=1 Tax=Kwoniella dejecticola CBS 10117 TaxID=1296121 RepID=A0A1A5ZTW0_9TREE|nr:uncharacterized protein I303_08633 [Kwoniella dejecticola CBS 10117]OBR81248.1 hypothetical protein I303_08633 [Kwoniella dejecticola CBS 10117]
MSTNPTSTSTAHNPSPLSSSTETETHQAVPPSIVASGTGVPSAPIETAEAQQAATAPGTGGIVEQPNSASSSNEEKITFKDQVNGYAKKIAGTVFRNEGEKEFGEKKLEGQA